MQYEKAFSYQWDDQQWPTKLGLAALISVVPILNLAIVGYMVGIIRNVAARAAQPLPHWDDFGRKFVDGLIITLAGLVYSAPIFITLAIPLSMLIASGALSRTSRLQDWGSLLGGASWLVLALVVIFCIIYALVLSIMRPVIMLIYSREGTFASCFRIEQIIQIISRHVRPFFVTWLVVLLAGIGVGLVVGLVNLVIGWVPCIGWAVGLVLGLGSTIYLLTVDAHLFGQFRLLALEDQSPITPAQDAKSQQNPGDLSS